MGLRLLFGFGFLGGFWVFAWLVVWWVFRWFGFWLLTAGVLVSCGLCNIPFWGFLVVSDCLVGFGIRFSGGRRLCIRLLCFPVGGLDVIVLRVFWVFGFDCFGLGWFGF